MGIVAAIVASFALNAHSMQAWQVSDKPAPIVVQCDVIEQENAYTHEETTTEQYGNTPESEYEPISDVVEPEYEYVPEIEYETAYVPSDGLTAEGGVNYYGGRLETYYSSNVLLHQDIADWTTDDEGFYRTPDGYYVVAASDMEQGTVFEGSKGKCIVLDSGCADGTTDYYVAW